MRNAVLLAALALISACGDDAGGGGAPGTPGAPAAAPVSANGTPIAPLVPRVHIEDRVPDNEKATIRHTFKERDFVAETNRDPFQSFIVLMPGTQGQGTNDGGGAQQPGALCTRAEQMKAPKYSYADLKLVGIVAESTQRKVLMIDSANYGYIIRRGDCVGKEKALVKDIGTGFITFVVMPENVPNTTTRPPEEHSVQLHPTDLSDADDVMPHGDDSRPSVVPVMPANTPTGPARSALPMPAPVPTPAGMPANGGAIQSPPTNLNPGAPPPAQAAPNAPSPTESPPAKT